MTQVFYYNVYTDEITTTEPTTPEGLKIVEVNVPEGSSGSAFKATIIGFLSSLQPQQVAIAIKFVIGDE